MAFDTILQSIGRLWQRPWKQVPSARPGRKVASFRPTLEAMGTRLVPTVTVATLDTNGDGTADTLQIVGDRHNNNVTIQHDIAAGEYRLFIDANADSDLTDANDVNGRVLDVLPNVVVKMKGGQDSVRYLQDSSFISSRVFNFTYDLGSGNDSFVFDSEQHALGNADLTVNVLAGSGDDQVTFGDFADIDGAGDFHFNVDLAAGNDTFDLQFPNGRLDMLLATTAEFLVHGGEGNDDLRAETGGGSDGDINIQNSAVLRILLFGDNGNDAISVDFTQPDIDLDGTLRILADGGAGKDSIDVRIDLLDALFGSNGTLDLDLLGQTGKDTLGLFLRSDSQVSYTSAGITLDGGKGTDAGTASFTNVPGAVVHSTGIEV